MYLDPVCMLECTLFPNAYGHCTRYMENCGSHVTGSMENVTSFCTHLTDHINCITDCCNHTTDHNNHISQTVTTT